MPFYQIDQGLADLANDIINTRRPYLKVVKIVYMFRPEAPISNGRAIAGMCIKVDDRNRTVHDFDFLIEIAKDIWNDASEEFRRALMDHELGHAGIRTDEQGVPQKDENTDRLKTYCKPHDIEEFTDVLEVYGAYHSKLRAFLNAFAAHKLAAKKKKGPEEAED